MNYREKQSSPWPLVRLIKTYNFAKGLEPLERGWVEKQVLGGKGGKKIGRRGL